MPQSRREDTHKNRYKNRHNALRTYAWRASSYSVHLAALHSDQRPISLSSRADQRTLWIHLCKSRNRDPCVSLSSCGFARDYLFYIKKILFCTERSLCVDCTFKSTKKSNRKILDCLSKPKTSSISGFLLGNTHNALVVDFVTELREMNSQCFNNENRKANHGSFFQWFS